MTFNKTSLALVDDAFASPQWSLCKYSSKVYDYFYEFSNEHFTRVRFDFVVRRKPTFYVINLIFPTGTLSLIQLLVFAIPSTDASSDRVAFGTTNLLTLVVFQTIITEEMPKSSDSVTALSKYIIALIIISAVGILESVTAERLLRPTLTPPPQWMLNVRIPLLWDSQLPTGIAHIILSIPEKPKEKQRKSQHKPVPPVDVVVVSRADNPYMRLSEAFSSKSKGRVMKCNKIVTESTYNGNNKRVQRTSYDENIYSTLTVDEAAPVHLNRLSRQMSHLSGMDEDHHRMLIRIGKQWGLIVTRIDGITFLICASLAFFLPMVIFLPLILSEHTCHQPELVISPD